MMPKTPPKTLIVVTLAIACGILAAISISVYVRQKIKAVQDQATLPMVERLVAARDLAAGTRLDANHLAIRSFPRDWVSSNSIPISKYESLQGKVLTTALKAGEALLPIHIMQLEASFSNNLAPGRRAISLPVDQVNSLSGLLKPGDLIDLYVTFTYQRKNLTAPLLQGVMVLATGQDTLNDTDGSMRNFSTITLDAAPDDVVKIVAARQAGSLTAILRNPLDDMPDKRASRGDLAALLGLSAPPVQKRKKAVVMYGSSKPVGIPAWARPATGSTITNGIFEMPTELFLSNTGAQQDNLYAVDATEINAIDYTDIGMINAN